MLPLYKPALVVALLTGVLLSAGCATVEPWEKEVLARPEMSLSADAITEGLEDHTYFSKEGSSGGRGFGGGGCGCN